jgi:hypothetical protein
MCALASSSFLVSTFGTVAAGLDLSARFFRGRISSSVPRKMLHDALDLVDQLEAGRKLVSV